MNRILKILASVVFTVAVFVGIYIVNTDTVRANESINHTHKDDGGLCPEFGDDCAEVCYPSPCDC